MKILPRYFFKELQFPFWVGLGLICFLMIMNRIIILIDLVLRHGVDFFTVLRLLAYVLPATFAIAVPMALLISILMALGRLSADSELTAMRAGGVGLVSLFKPTLIWAILLSIGMLGFNEFVLPQSNLAYKTLFFKIVSQRSNVIIRENTYAEDLENMVVHVGTKDEKSDNLQDLTIFRFEAEKDYTPQLNLQIITAQTGKLVSDRDALRVYLDLFNGQVQSSNLQNQGELTQMAFQKAKIDFDLSGGLKQIQGEDKKPQEMTIREMQNELSAAGPDDSRHRDWGIHIHKKIAIAFACLAFAVIAFPLGCSVKKGGRLIGFTWSLGLIFFYYLMLTFGDSQGAEGNLSPWLSQWMANFSLFGVGLILFFFMDRGRSGHAR